MIIAKQGLGRIILSWDTSLKELLHARKRYALRDGHSSAFACIDQEVHKQKIQIGCACCWKKWYHQEGAGMQLSKLSYSNPVHLCKDSFHWSRICIPAYSVLWKQSIIVDFRGKTTIYFSSLSAAVFSRRPHFSPPGNAYRLSAVI